MDLTATVGPLTLPNPVIAASGTFGHGAELAALCDPTGIGAVTVKSIAAYPWDGNRGLRVTEAPGGGMLNSVGLCNDLKGLSSRGSPMYPKGESIECTRTLSVMPKGHRLPGPGGHADGFNAGVDCRGAIKINR